MHIKGISGSTLKTVAIVSMLLDHIAAIVMDRMLMPQGMFQANQELYDTCMTVAEAFRFIGRIAMPIFCFLLVQGFLHTSNLKKYLGRLFLLALISEVPFDLGFYGVPFYWQHQNVFFALFLGILCASTLKKVENKGEWNIIWRIPLWVLTVGVCGGAAYFLETDYAAGGVLAIAVMYSLRSIKTLSVGIGCVALNSVPALISLIPVYLYNGQRGSHLKWVFYLFYPVHLLLLYLISCAMGLGDIVF